MQLVIPFETYFELHHKMEVVKRTYPNSVVLFLHQYQYYFTQELQPICKLLMVSPKEDRTLLPCQFACFPEVYLDKHLPKLIKSGYRVAVCDPNDATDPKTNN